MGVVLVQYSLYLTVGRMSLNISQAMELGLIPLMVRPPPESDFLQGKRGAVSRLPLSVSVCVCA